MRLSTSKSVASRVGNRESRPTAAKNAIAAQENPVSVDRLIAFLRTTDATASLSLFPPSLAF